MAVLVFFVLSMLSCMLFGVDMVMVLMREYPLDWELQKNFGIRKGPKLVHLGIWETWILLSNS